MAKGFKHGAGGIPLNFKVVGGTSAPSNPKQNTIWVNTGNEITAWAFSANEPSMSKNIAEKSLVGTSTYTGWEALYVKCELLPNTTYTLSFEGNEGSSYYISEKIATIVNFTARSGRTTVTFTTNSTLNRTDTTQFSSYEHMWMLVKNASMQEKANVFNKVQLEKGSSHDGNYVPYGGIEGGVWITTNNSKDLWFNALKKNGIMIYPATAKQYLAGSWKKKDAVIYLSGAWNSLASVIVPNVNAVWESSGASVEQTLTETKVTLIAKDTVNGTAETSYSYTEIDTTGYDTLYIACTHSVNNTSGSGQTSEVLLGSLSGSVVSSVYYKVINAGTNSGTVSYSKTIDISALSGIYRIKCNATSWTTTPVTHYITITDCRMY